MSQIKNANGFCSASISASSHGFGVNAKRAAIRAMIRLTTKFNNNVTNTITKICATHSSKIANQDDHSV
ncbi:MAG: hypothetical protein KDI00_05130 [Pseudomonadales bacterium]|nr:hypothetical protein [Pseudomonadales bacterium]